MVYARVQKESRSDEVTWADGGGGTTKGVGPPHSLAEQLKQVRVYFLVSFPFKKKTIEYTSGTGRERKKTGQR